MYVLFVLPVVLFGVIRDVVVVILGCVFEDVVVHVCLHTVLRGQMSLFSVHVLDFALGVVTDDKHNMSERVQVVLIRGCPLVLRCHVLVCMRVLV